MRVSTFSYPQYPHKGRAASSTRAGPDRWRVTAHFLHTTWRGLCSTSSIFTESGRAGAPPAHQLHFLHRGRARCMQSFTRIYKQRARPRAFFRPGGAPKQIKNSYRGPVLSTKRINLFILWNSWREYSPGNEENYAKMLVLSLEGSHQQKAPGAVDSPGVPAFRLAYA